MSHDPRLTDDDISAEYWLSVLRDGDMAAKLEARRALAAICERRRGRQPLCVQRMGFAPVTCPTTPSLEAEFYPNGRTIAAKAFSMVRPSAPAWLPDERSDLKDIEFKGPF